MPDETKEQQPPQPKIEFVVPDPDDGLFTTYANNIATGWTNFDIRMIFGEVVEVSQEKIVVEQRAHITIAYLQAKMLMIMLEQIIAQHESVFGEVKLPPEMAFNSQITEAKLVSGMPIRPPRS